MYIHLRNTNERIYVVKKSINKILSYQYLKMAFERKGRPGKDSSKRILLKFNSNSSKIKSLGQNRNFTGDKKTV